MYISILSALLFCAPLLSLDPLNFSLGALSYARLEQEFSSPPYLPAKVSTICRMAEDLHKQTWSQEIQKFSSQKIAGSFFTLPAQKAVLYTPPFIDAYMIDKGAFKRVYRGVFCTRGAHEAVAACVGSRKAILHEVSFFRKIGDLLENPFLASFSLEQDAHLLVLRYYNVGSLRKLRDSNIHFEDKDKLALARCLVNTLIVLHKNGIAHRDIHDGNILLRATPSGELRGGIIDFGRATLLSAKTDTVPQGAPRRNPPEVILLPFHNVDKRRSDIYALGCSLYYIFFSKIYEGISLFDVKTVSSLTSSKRKMLFNSVLKAHASLYKIFQEELSEKAARGKAVSVVDKVKKCIFLMVHPDPEKRIELERVFELLSSK